MTLDYELPLAQGANAPRQKVVFYKRVSTVNQAIRGDGLSSQEAMCREYAQRKGYEVLGVFEDTITGEASQRPGMNAMLRFLRKHSKDRVIVVVDHPNRFSRDTRGYWDLRELLDAAGGRLESPNMKFGDSAADRFLQNIIVAGSQYQREQNAEQVIDRMKGRLLNGYWPFFPPRGMKHERVPGHGNLLVRVEPEASVIAEGLEAYASGRLATQADLTRWLDGHPDFGKGYRTHITNQQTKVLLTTFLYAGVVEKPEWGVSRRKGRHEGIISYETYEKIQARLNGSAYAPRASVNDDFPLRGGVVCAECGRPLTACWSRSKTGAKHPYYMCFAKGCARYRKSIRKDVIEGEFVELLENLTPKPALLEMTRAMFKSARQQREAQADAIAASFDRQIADADRKIAALLDRIVEATSSVVAAAFEKRVDDLERAKLAMLEKRKQGAARQGTFDELFELALGFISNPCKIWRLGRLEYQRLVLRLAFSGPLAYAPEGGFRTPQTTTPFSMLADNRGAQKKLAERETGQNRPFSGHLPLCCLSDRQSDRQMS